MEQNDNKLLNEADYTNFAEELIKLPNQLAKLDNLKSKHQKYYEVNRSFYKQFIYKIEELITDLRDDIFEKTAVLAERNPKFNYVEVTKQYEGIYKNPSRGQFTIKALEGLKDFVYKFEYEVLENKIDMHYWFLSSVLTFIKNDINDVFKFISENDVYKNVRVEIEENGTIYFQYFQSELKNKLEKQENWKVIEIDIKDRFLPMIHKYYEWYEINKEETKKFEPANFYEWMYEVMRSTEKEINKWFKAEQPAAPESLSVEKVEEKKESEVKLFHREIALLHHYLGTSLNDNNASIKASLYGQNSGRKLMEHYNEIKNSNLNITNHKYAVKNIEKVITLLNNNPQAKEKAENDLKVAQTKKN